MLREKVNKLTEGSWRIKKTESRNRWNSSKFQPNEWQVILLWLPVSMSMKEPITKCKDVFKSFQKMFSVVTSVCEVYHVKPWCLLCIDNNVSEAGSQFTTTLKQWLNDQIMIEAWALLQDMIRHNSLADNIRHRGLWSLLLKLYSWLRIHSGRGGHNCPLLPWPGPSTALASDSDSTDHYWWIPHF